MLVSLFIINITINSVINIFGSSLTVCMAFKTTAIKYAERLLISFFYYTSTREVEMIRCQLQHLSRLVVPHLV